jgi:60 kDa SS-A/Ro ribonucleoprotein
MRHNQPVSYAVKTHGGAPAVPHLTPYQQLRRTVLSCLLWENQFYESGVSVADRITQLCDQCTAEQVAQVAIEARNDQRLRHVPLLLCTGLAKKGGSTVSKTLYEVIQRPDELTEFLSLYWRNGRTPIAKQVKLGLAKAFTKFSAHSLSKYNRDNAIKLRDVLFLVHAKPKDEAQAETWKQLVDGTLPTADTWETNLSAGKDKKETFERLLREENLGYLALLRNLRGMTEAGVDETLIKNALLARKNGADKVLPFRYVAAARACPRLEPTIDQALQKAISELPPLSGKTVILVDVSGSMDAPLSQKSDLRRIDAACALASLINGDARMFSFSNNVIEVPPRRGMAGVDALIRSQPHGWTALAEAVRGINQNVKCDRLIVITDEQATTGGIPNPVAPLAYMINVAAYKNGVGYGAWTHIDGFSESVIRWIVEYEAESAAQ